MTKEEIDNYIIDWHWDEESHKFSLEFAQYISDFLDDLEKKWCIRANIQKAQMELSTSREFHVSIWLSR